MVTFQGGLASSLSSLSFFKNSPGSRTIRVRVSVTQGSLHEPVTCAVNGALPVLKSKYLLNKGSHIFILHWLPQIV